MLNLEKQTMNTQLTRSGKTIKGEDEEEEIREEKDDKPSDVNEVVEQKLLENRQIFLWGAVEDETAKDLVGKLLYLEALKPGEEITFFINSPGGVISSGMAIIDTMQMISSPVTTVCMGLAASMGSLILSAGALVFHCFVVVPQRGIIAFKTVGSISFFVFIKALPVIFFGIDVGFQAFFDAGNAVGPAVYPWQNLVQH